MMRFARYRPSQMADRLVDSKTGVIKTCSGLMRGAHEPKFFIDITEIGGRRGQRGSGRSPGRLLLQHRS